MTPIFTPDFTAVEASIPLYEKGRYRVKVTKVTPFAGESKDDKGNVTQNGGVRYGLEMVGKFNETGVVETTDMIGRTVTPYKVWLHSEGGWKFAKPFLMAALGFTIKEEAAANEEMQKGDWTFNGDKDTPTENMQIGASYQIPVGKLLDVSMWKSETKDKNDKMFENQEFGSWAPVK